jgi:hypothetical protein
LAVFAWTEIDRMNPLWDRLDALAGQATTSFFGTDCRITPRIESEYAGARPDPGREPQTVRGIFSLKPAIQDVRGQRIQGEFAGTTMMVESDAQVQISAAEAAKVGYLPKAGDRAFFPYVPAHQVYSIAVVHVVDCGDLLLLLNKEAP